MGPRVDGAVVGDHILGCTLSTDLDHAVGRGGVEGVDENIGDIGEDNVIARVMEETGNKTAA